jgi:hypothetical protein
MIGTSAALATTSLVGLLPGSPTRSSRGPPRSSSGVYVVGFVAGFFLPEPKPQNCRIRRGAVC